MILVGIVTLGGNLTKDKIARVQGTRVPAEGINPSLFLLRLQLLPQPAPALLAILGRSPVCIHTGTALSQPSRQFPPLLVRAFCAPPVSPHTLVQLWVSSFLLNWNFDPSSG
jgi:hypothetical protein